MLPSYSATDAQKGQAAGLRDSFAKGSDVRRELNQIVHSEDRNPHQHGQNPYAGKPKQYDGAAQKTLDQAERMKGSK